MRASRPLEVRTMGYMPCRVPATYFECFIDLVVEVTPPPPPTTISYNGTTIASSAGGVNCTACTVVVGQQIALTGYPVIDGTWNIGGPTYASWYPTSGGGPNPTAPASGTASFYWVSDANNKPTNNYNVSYTVNGVTASATFTVVAPSVVVKPFLTFPASVDTTSNTLSDEGSELATVTPPGSYTGTPSWTQVITAATALLSGAGGQTGNCPPPG